MRDRERVCVRERERESESEREGERLEPQFLGPGKYNTFELV